MCRYPEQFSDTAGCWMTADLPLSGFLIQRIRQWGIRRIYGYPGDGINGGIETAIIGMPNV